MRKITLVIVLALGTSFLTYGQKKSELLAQIETLKTELGSVQDSLAKTKREASANAAEAATFKSQNESLRDANATLLKNLSGFAEISSKNTETVNKALSSLEEKEKQLKAVTETISKNDSTSIVILTKAKQILGDDAKVSTSNGDINITQKLDMLFESDTSTTLSETGSTWLEKVSKVILSNPTRVVNIEALNITGEFNTSYAQASVVANALVKTYTVPVERLNIIAKDGNFKEGINIRLQPDYAGFYKNTKEQMKNQ